MSNDNNLDEAIKVLNDRIKLVSRSIDILEVDLLKASDIVKDVTANINMYIEQRNNLSQAVLALQRIVNNEHEQPLESMASTEDPWGGV